MIKSSRLRGGCADEASPLVRVTHLAAGAPPISVYANDDRVPLVASLAFRESTDYVEVSEETSTLRITAAGASPAAMDESAFLERRSRPQRGLDARALDA